MIVKEGTIPEQFAGTFTSPQSSVMRLADPFHPWMNDDLVDVELRKQIGAATYVEWNSKVQHVQFCCKLTLCRMECLQFHQNVKDVFDTIIKVVSMKWRLRNMGCSIVLLDTRPMITFFCQMLPSWCQE
ncbi:hypothetical protein K7X08_017652 [Anisodus acutangulus]|uniref:Uncharacterized protein n=1 Tax=Anisodus acutangulus TaxID=402998 RepID=A0A9Q1R6K0_9SOLA|nr:hypothetical protein K7X08_017652 [Anisodus acutangulus]